VFYDAHLAVCVVRRCPLSAKWRLFLMVCFMALLFYYTGICIRVFEAWMLFRMPQLVVVYCCYCLKHKNPLILSRTEKRQYALYARVCDSGRISVPKKDSAARVVSASLSAATHRDGNFVKLVSVSHCKSEVAHFHCLFSESHNQQLFMNTCMCLREIMCPEFCPLVFGDVWLFFISTCCSVVP